MKCLAFFLDVLVSQLLEEVGLKDRIFQSEQKERKSFDSPFHVSEFISRLWTLAPVAFQFKK